MSWGLYVHVPWCRFRCPYCAFVLQTSAPQVDTFLEQIRLRLAASDLVGSPETLYIGGGTPSRLGPDGLGRLLDVLPRATDETTVELNPEDVDDVLLDTLLDHGVDRVSLGVQSFDPATARRLGRARSATTAPAAIERISRRFRSWSLDLIFGVDGQTPDALKRDLERASLAPHVSAYGLTIETETRFGRARRNPAVDPDAWRVAYDTVVSTLEAAGLARYEVSNFARHGHESRHNRRYWHPRGVWVGWGPGAHGRRADGTLVIESDDVEAWLNGAPPTLEAPTPEHLATDWLHAGLRTREGIDLSAMRRALGWTPTLPSALADHFVYADGRLSVRPESLALVDGLAARLVLSYNSRS